MGTGSPEKLRFGFVRDEGILWVSQKAGSVICRSLVILGQQKLQAAQMKGFWCHTKQDIVHLSFGQDPSSFDIFLWVSSHKLPGTVNYLLSVKKQIVRPAMCLHCDDTIPLQH